MPTVSHSWDASFADQGGVCHLPGDAHQGGRFESISASVSRGVHHVGGGGPGPPAVTSTHAQGLPVGRRAIRIGPFGGVTGALLRAAPGCWLGLVLAGKKSRRSS